MYQNLQIPSPLQEIEISTGQIIYIKREDLIHPMLSGNKFRKLKYNLQYALSSKFDKIISFGGAFSNHIHALAFSCHAVNLPLLLFVRGEDVKNPTLDFVRSCGADIKFIDRSEYKLRNTPDYLSSLALDYPNSFIIPEGGSNIRSIKGVGEMVEEVYAQLEDVPCEICVSYGSGGTSLGILNKIKSSDRLHIFPALRIQDLENKIIQSAKSWNIYNTNFVVHPDFHFGGYAKWNHKLIEYLNDFKDKYKIQLDPIYTAKLFFGVNELLSRGYFDNDKKLIVIHTGGLQGVAGFNSRFGNIIR